MNIWLLIKNVNFLSAPRRPPRHMKAISLDSSPIKILWQVKKMPFRFALHFYIEDFFYFKKNVKKRIHEYQG